MLAHGSVLAVPWSVYTFPDFPYPKELQPQKEYPTGKEVHAYVQAYARKFDLYRCGVLPLSCLHDLHTFIAQATVPPCLLSMHRASASPQQLLLCCRTPPRTGTSA